MKNEYVKINKTAIEEQIKELEWSLERIPESYIPKHEAQIYAYKQVLSKSTPLIPEIKESYTKGFSEGVVFGMNTEYKYKTSEDYISNLKLDV